MWDLGARLFDFELESKRSAQNRLGKRNKNRSGNLLEERKERR